MLLGVDVLSTLMTLGGHCSDAASGMQQHRLLSRSSSNPQLAVEVVILCMMRDCNTHARARGNQETA
jgi:hypothetical protein